MYFEAIFRYTLVCRAESELKQIGCLKMSFFDATPSHNLLHVASRNALRTFAIIR